MPRFEPFAGLRYDPQRVVLDDVVAPPYDVVGAEELERLESRSTFNAIRVELPREDYDRAARLLREWVEDGVLTTDGSPCFYGHRMSFRGEDGTPRRTDGVIGALRIETPGEGDVLPHERTTPKAKDDRLSLLRSTQANISPIWGLSMANGLTDVLGLDEREADAAASDDEGVLHELWRIDDPARIDAIATIVATAPVVIADGHHRYETAHVYAGERREAGAEPGDQDLVMALVVELSPDQLEVRAIHRLLDGLPEGFDLADALAASFAVEETSEEDGGLLAAMRDAGALALVTPAGRWLLTPHEATDAAAEHALDSSRLDVALQSLPPHELRFQHGVAEVIAAIGDGEAQAAVLLRPATVDDITRTGTDRVRMPPKTTFFWPKPRTGLVLRPLA